MDHFWEVAKFTIGWEKASGVFFADVIEIVLMLERKFGDEQHAKYTIKELLEKDIWEANGLTVFNKVVVFKPNSPTILAAEHMCLSEICKAAHGTCALCKKDCLNGKLLKQTSLRSFVKELNKSTTQSNSSSHEFLLLGSICAIAAYNSPDTICFIYIEEDKVAGKDKINNYGHKIPEGIQFVHGR